MDPLLVSHIAQRKFLDLWYTNMFEFAFIGEEMTITISIYSLIYK